MLFVDYFFEKLFDGSILMDRELKPSSLNVQTGDVFVVSITEQGRIFLQKQQPLDNLIDDPKNG